jgi:uncharacterized short protein YbdD (DUF466 family)
MTTHTHDATVPASEATPAPKASFIEIVRKIIGVPDYERYKAHMAEHHPECAPMTEAEFADDRLVNKYSKPGQRCC